ncbi:hypothetical protein IEQ34_001530 [Dendrobium chrysotoxum]|uniref:Uncharacterized protein n=1 Tax=Dendrobium chrysotoxum TaxID=161865 RepID=A0AAV7HNI8_DENCH|nr:hypothetical protein IEQ34_001530 [Dendrobium chrysotoxum]
MDRLLLLSSPATPIHSQCRSSILAGSIHFVVKAGGRKRRRRITGIALTEVLRLAISLASPFRRLLSTELSSLDLFLQYGGGDAGGRPPIWTGGASGRWWRWPGSGRSRSKTIFAVLVILVLASAPVLVGGGRSQESDMGIRVLIPVILGMGIAYWKRLVGVAILGLSLCVLALRRRGKKRFGWR